MSETRHLSLPEELCAAAEKRFAQFRGIESLLEFLLNELVSDEAEKLDLKEKAMLEQRLRDLGYM